MRRGAKVICGYLRFVILSTLGTRMLKETNEHRTCCAGSRASPPGILFYFRHGRYTEIPRISSPLENEIVVNQVGIPPPFELLVREKAFGEARVSKYSNLTEREP